MTKRVAILTLLICAVTARLSSAANVPLDVAEQEPKPDVPAAAVFVGETPAPAGSPLSLWYRRPAQRWLEA